MNNGNQTYIFQVVIEDDAFEDGRPAFHAYCPALKQYGAATWGATKQEALQHIQEVVEMVVEEMVEEGLPLPGNSSPDAQFLAELRVAVTLGYGN